MVHCTVKIDLPTANELVKKAGLAEDGAVQRFHTQNVLRRIEKYMPRQSGFFIKLTVAQTDINKPEIVTAAPNAAFLYYGKVMVGDETGSPWAQKGETKHVVEDWDINFNKEKNQRAGPLWDKALVANEGDILVQELQNFINQYLGGIK